MTTSPLTEKINRMRTGAQEIRETLAAQAYGLEAVVEMMARATAMGYRAVKISPPVQVDLSDTEAGRETVAELRQAGASVEWVARASTDADLGERVLELVVRW